MKLDKRLILCMLVLLALISVADLLIRPGHPVTFDGHIHMTTMNQFAQSLADGEFPVTWSNNFANFGLPLPLFAHRLPAYLGAVLILLGASTETAYTVLVTFSLIGATILFYVFFRKYANQLVSLTATGIATFFPYRALNIYTRGALPEIMSTLFLPIVFLSIWNLQHKKYHLALGLLFMSTLGIALTHPMMLLIFFIPLSLYFLSGLDKRTALKQVVIAASSVGLALLAASYYLLPLFLEMKYFYQANIQSSIVNDGFLSLTQLYSTQWFYTFTHPGPRGNFIKLGLFELSIFIASLIVLFLSQVDPIKKYVKKKALPELKTWIAMSVMSLLLLLPVTKLLYTLPLVDKIQYPWRFLNVLQFLLPGLFVMLTQAVPKLQNKIVLVTLLALVLWLRVPEFYGKNYIVQPESDYAFTTANLHSLNMNPVWTGNSEEYPTKEVQAEIIEGTGTLEISTAKNASREYQIDSETEIRMIDYTFYFPGWNVFVDGNPVEIEYQDTRYRGLITYRVPAGKHTLSVIYSPTRIRLLSGVLSGLGLFIFGLLSIVTKKKKLLL